MADDLFAAMRRYVQLIQPLLASGGTFVPRAETNQRIQVERGGAYADALLADFTLTDDSSLDAVMERSPQETAVVDATGHQRPVYRGLLIYSALQTLAGEYETLPTRRFSRWFDGLTNWCSALAEELTDFDFPADALPAARGSESASLAWAALCLHLAGTLLEHRTWTAQAADVFAKLHRRQLASGAFLAAGAADNPETHWYHELIILHAVASFAVQTEDRGLSEAVGAAAEFHLNETQPDHASAQPWGVFAFAWHAPARSLADQLLHTVSTRPSATADVTRLVLADALYCFKLFG